MDYTTLLPEQREAHVQTSHQTLDTATWKPLQPGYPRWGGKRAGAGRLRKMDRAAGVVNLKNEDEEMAQHDAPALSTSGEKSSLQLLEERPVVNLKTAQEEVTSSDMLTRSTPETKSSLQLTASAVKSRLQQPDNSRLQLEAGSQDFKITTPVPVLAAQGAASDQQLRRRLRKKYSETPDVVSERMRLSRELA